MKPHPFSIALICLIALTGSVSADLRGLFAKHAAAVLQQGQGKVKGKEQ